MEVVLGDARVQLERELAEGHPENFDVLAVDAFSGDAIPIHLVTAECADIYRRHLKPGGILLLHVSNRTLDLQPVARGVAKHLGWDAMLVNSENDINTGESTSDWVVISQNQTVMNMKPLEDADTEWDQPNLAPWSGPTTSRASGGC